jgi:hypothetical protein
MPALANITVFDRESTPASHVFAPQSLKDGVATLFESHDYPLGRPTLTIRSSETQDYFRKKIVLSVPHVVTETINGVDVHKVLGVSWGELTMRYHRDASPQERANMMGYFDSLLDSGTSIVGPVFIDDEGIW